eukprot:9472923-Pyramimonas_sp.AAC.1
MGATQNPIGTHLGVLLESKNWRPPYWNQFDIRSESKMSPIGFQEKDFLLESSWNPIGWGSFYWNPWGPT